MSHLASHQFLPIRLDLSAPTTATRGGGRWGKILRARDKKGPRPLEPRPRLVTRHAPGSLMNGLSTRGLDTSGLSE